MIQSLAVQQEFGAEIGVSDALTTITPVGGRVNVLIDTVKSTGESLYETLSCLDETCQKHSSYTESYANDPETGEGVITLFARSTMTKIDSATWLSAMNDVFNDYDIPAPEDAFSVVPGFDGPSFIKPFDPTVETKAPECHTLVCPTEEDWKARDPVLGMSPYVEPDGVLTGGFIAGITIASIVVAVVIFSYIYKRGVEARERRVKEAVLKSIAETMNITVSKDLSSCDLDEMFKKIDADDNGNLSKDEVKGLVDEAGVVNMSDRDYDVLFNSIDLDRNGTLDFVEFCAFFASISINEDKFVDHKA